MVALVWLGLNDCRQDYSISFFFFFYGQIHSHWSSNPTWWILQPKLVWVLIKNFIDLMILVSFKIAFQYVSVTHLVKWDVFFFFFVFFMICCYLKMLKVCIYNLLHYSFYSPSLVCQTYPDSIILHRFIK